ncbi:MAG: peptide chain release factor N(5)-glutamine methyltransferase [Clostridia bacterium]|nr:peptide chain release factor N(5)-glutamine methyltransferase [Clostridia bacterium]
MTYFQFKKYIKEALSGVAGEYAAYEAEKIVCHLTGFGRTALSLRSREEMHEIPTETENIIARRQNGEPLAYILGNVDFFGLNLYVNASCLTPRADTEVIVERALEFLGERNARVLDICTGSGCIALAIAANSHAEVLGIDISAEALAVANKNAEKCALSEKVRFEQRDALAADFASGGEKYDLIVSNPPYIPTADIAALSAEVHREPMLALDGGADGLVFYRRFLAVLPAMLKDGGAMIFEIGYDQEAALRSLCEKAALPCEIFRDYGGNVRGAVIKVKAE